MAKLEEKEELKQSLAKPQQIAQEIGMRVIAYNSIDELVAQWHDASKEQKKKSKRLRINMQRDTKYRHRRNHTNRRIMPIINSSSFLLFRDEDAIGHSKNVTVNLRVDLPDATTKDSYGWKEVIACARGGEVNVKYLTAYNDTLNFQSLQMILY